MGGRGGARRGRRHEEGRDTKKYHCKQDQSRPLANSLAAAAASASAAAASDATAATQLDGADIKDAL